MYRKYRFIALFCLVLAVMMGSCLKPKFTNKQGVRKVDDSLSDEQQAEQKLKETVDINKDPPSQAKTKGVFTLWTEPLDPAPLQHYYVVVQVSIESSKIGSYQKNDLSGKLKGSDNFYQKLGVKLDVLEKYPDKGYVRLYARIPGSNKGVKDDITVSSKMFNQTQDFHIEF